MPLHPKTPPPSKTVRVAGPLPGLWLEIDLENGTDLSIPLDFSSEDPNLYGVPHAMKEAWESNGIIGDTRKGGSCNVDTLHLTPHCQGTHTECIGHLSNERIFIINVAPKGLLNAQLVTIQPEAMTAAGESSRPTLDPEHVGITKRVLSQSLSMPVHPTSHFHGTSGSGYPWAKALIIRTVPNDPEKTSATYSDNSAPFFSIEAIQYLIQLGIEHILVDLPSLDRLSDNGEMAAHRTWWDIEAGSHSSKKGPASRRTISELLFIPDSIPDGLGLLSIQIPPFRSDAAPSRPIYFQGKLTVTS